MTNAEIVMFAHHIVFLAEQAAQYRGIAGKCSTDFARQMCEQHASSIDDDIATLCGNLRREIKAD